MAKQATQFPHGSLNVFGRNIPLKSNGGLNMVHLTLEERIMRKINVLNFGLLLTVVLFFVSCASEQEKKTSALIEKIKAEKENDLKNTKLSIAFIDACYKKYQAFKEELSDNNKDGKLSKKTVYKEAKKVVESYYYSVDTLKSLYVAQLLEGEYEGNGGLYIYNQQYNVKVPSGVSSDLLSLKRIGYSALKTQSTSLAGHTNIEDFQIAVGSIYTLSDTLIKGVFKLKPEGSNDAKAFCEFEWNKNELSMYSNGWYLNNHKK